MIEVLFPFLILLTAHTIISDCIQQLMSQIASKQETSSTVVQGIKSLFQKLNWKHALLLSVSIGLAIYPQPIIRLFMPVVSKISKNHQTIECKNFVKEIILTSNESLTFEIIEKLQITKGSKPKIKEFKLSQRKCLEVMGSKRKKSGLIVSSTSSAIGVPFQENEMLYGETLWNNFRIAKLEDQHLKLVLIKSPESVLQIFLVRFYGMTEGDVHKLGSFPSNKIHILRLDERVGTYEHLTAEVENLG